MLLLGVD